MIGEELLKVGETKLNFRKKDGKLIRVHRIVNVSDGEVEYTTVQGILKRGDEFVECKAKKVKIEDIEEVCQQHTR